MAKITLEFNSTEELLELLTDLGILGRREPEPEQETVVMPIGSLATTPISSAAALPPSSPLYPGKQFSAEEAINIIVPLIFDKKVFAVKCHREATGMGLFESKSAVYDDIFPKVEALVARFKKEVVETEARMKARAAEEKEKEDIPF